jgi:hypothetical protein
MRRAASCGCRDGSNFIDESLILMTASLAARPSPSPVDRRPSRRRRSQARAMTLTIARALSPKQPKAFDPLGRRQGKEGTLNRQRHRSLAGTASQVNGSRTLVEIVDNLIFAPRAGTHPLHRHQAADRAAGRPGLLVGSRRPTREALPGCVDDSRRGRPPSAPLQTRATTLTVARDSLTPKALSARRPGGLWTLKIPTDCSADPRRPDHLNTPAWARSRNRDDESTNQLDPADRTAGGTSISTRHQPPVRRSGRPTRHHPQPRRTTLGVRRGLSASG